MSEVKLTTSIIDRIYQEGRDSFAVKYHGGPASIKGMPDLIGAWRGVPFAVEIKVPGQEKAGLSLAQKAWLSVFKRGGYVVGVVSSIEEFQKLFGGRLTKVTPPDYQYFR